MNIQSSQINYERGKIVQAAQMLLARWFRGDDFVPEYKEFCRLWNNLTQQHISTMEEETVVNAAALVVAMGEGYVPCK